jgi:beta-N-acetylhexosaminidase
MATPPSGGSPSTTAPASATGSIPLGSVPAAGSGTDAPLPTTGRGPVPATQPAGLTVTATDRARAAKVVTGMSTADKAASVIMADSGQLIGTGLLSQFHFGGVILMGSRGIVEGTSGGTPEQVAQLTADLRQEAAADPTGAPILIGTDQEYGDVTRLQHGFTTFPGAGVLAAIPDTATAATTVRAVAAAAAQEMLAVGVTVDFAPVSDVLPSDGSASAIGDRSYGSDPQRDATLVTAAVTGYQSGGVAAVLKHFPGLGRVATDTHLALPSLPVDCESWNTHEAVPVRAGIKAGAAMVMTGHVLLPAVGASRVPASLSPTVVGDLLRGSGAAGCSGLGYRGVTVTDSLQMAPVADSYNSAQAAVMALNAGQDLLLMPMRPDAVVAGIVDAVQSGELAASRLDDAATAVLALRFATARVTRPPLSVVDSPAHQALAAKAWAASGS